MSGAAGAVYSLVVNRDADFGLETDGGFSSAQNISGTKGVLSDILASPASPTENWYSINLAANQAILLQTVTPPGAGSQFADDLAPQIQVFSPADVLVASGQGQGNQAVEFVATTAGPYRIRIFGNDATNGEYFLSATGPEQVMSASDSGAGSLREALLDFVGAPGLTHFLEFDLPPSPQNISLLSPLPTLSDPLVVLLDPTQDVTISSMSAASLDNFSALTKTGDGELTLSETESVGGKIEVDAGSLCLAEPATLTITPGTNATVSGTGTFELAGIVSNLTGAVNITNNSTSANGILVVGTNQVVGGIDGSGNLAVATGSELTANHIAQGALMIGGAIGSPATVTIAASDATGNPLTTSSSATSTGSEALTASTGQPLIECNSSRSLTADIFPLESSAMPVGARDEALPAQRLAEPVSIEFPPSHADLPPAWLARWTNLNDLPRTANGPVEPATDIRLPSLPQGSLGGGAIVRGESAVSNCYGELAAADTIFASDFGAAIRARSAWGSVIVPNASDELLAASLADDLWRWIDELGPKTSEFIGKT